MSRFWPILLAIFAVASPLASGGDSNRLQHAVVSASFSEEISQIDSPEPIAITKELVDSEQATIQAAELSDTEKTDYAARLTKANGALQAAEEELKKSVAFETQSKSIPEMVEKVRAVLATKPETVDLAIPAEATVTQLESQLAQLKQRVDAIESDFAAKNKEIESRPTRIQEINKESIELQKRIATSQEHLPKLPPADVDQRTKWFESAARYNTQLKQLHRLQSERRYLEGAVELLTLQRDVVQRELKELKRRYNAFQTAVEAWRKKESKRQADEARRTAEQSHPALRSMAEANAAIAETRIATASGIERVGKTIKTLTDTSKTLATDFEDLRKKVEYAGTTSSTGLLLRKKRGDLPTPSEFAERDAFVKEETPRVHLQLMEWKKLQQEVADSDDAAAIAVSQLQALQQEYGHDQVLQVVTRLIEDRRGLLDNAIGDQEKYLQDLNEMDLANQTLKSEVEEFRSFLDQRILWMRSDEILSADDFRQATGGVAILVSPARWAEVVRVACGDIARRPSIGLAVFALFALIVLYREKLLAIQRNLSEPPAAGQPASFARYVNAFAITFLVAIRWPILMLAIGYRLKLASGSTAWTQSVGDACLTTVVLLWGCELLREITRSNGMGERLFRWPAEATKPVRRTLRTSMLLGTPLLALLLLSQYGELAASASLHRLMFIATILLFVVQIGVLLSPGGKMMSAVAAKRPDAAIYRARFPVWLATTAAPGGFALLSILGYHYSAYQLSGKLAETGAALVGLVLLHSLAILWLEVTSHNRKLRRELQRQETESAESPAMLSSDSMTMQTPAVDEDTLEAETQTEVRHFLKYAVATIMLCGGWIIWADVLPALHILDGVELWQNIESVAETVTAPNGVESVQITEHAVPTTLTDVLTAMLVFVGTVLVSRRLPGFLELTLLDRIPLDQGGRQAIAILMRYAATLAGMLFACHIIRLSWNSVQWLAAAMTVGLGFGLQEIFANLVSGIIILFERPIRIGDLVTVGDITGNVSKMRMRATTITDFDRRELIVPNKKFITDNVINWTLSDPISRVVLPVGVAYGTDIPRVEKILLRIAKQCSYVMKEPAPSTLFKGFGDSTLDVDLRVFIPTRDIYADVVNHLNKAIASEFKQAEIEIAYPQRDLHIKSYESMAGILPKEKRDAA